MAAPQVSAQALINEAERHKTWESLEQCLVNLLTNGQVLDYKHEGDFVEVTLNGTNRPVKLAVRKPGPPPSAEVAGDAFEAAPETKGGVATAVRAAKTAQKTAKVAQKAVQAPVGVVALVGLKTESYEHHAARLVKHALKIGSPKLVNVEQAAETILAEWYKGLK